MRAIWGYWKDNFTLCGHIWFKSKCSNWLPTGFWFSDLPPAPDTVLDKLFLCCFSFLLPQDYNMTSKPIFHENISQRKSPGNMAMNMGKIKEIWIYLYLPSVIYSFANFRINSTLLTALGLLVSNFRYFNFFHFV